MLAKVKCTTKGGRVLETEAEAEYPMYALRYAMEAAYGKLDEPADGEEALDTQIVKIEAVVE